MNFRKSQAAMEFLMTYGWAILVVLVAIGALAYFGVLSPDNFLPNRCQLPAGIGCTDFLVEEVSGASDTVKVVLQNGLGFDLDTLTVSIAEPNCAGGTSTPSSLNNGEKATFTITCDLGGTLSAGKKFNADLGVQYDNSDSGLSHVANGSITGKVQ
jgi:hypothetical protein